MSKEGDWWYGIFKFIIVVELIYVKNPETGTVGILQALN